MSAYVLAMVVSGYAIAFTALAAVGAWLYRRGRVEGTNEKTIVDNTDATKELTATVGRLNDSLTVGFKEVHDRIDGHDVDIAVAKRDIQHLTAHLIVSNSPGHQVQD